MKTAWWRPWVLDALMSGIVGLACFFIGFGRSPLALKEPLGSGDLTYYYGYLNAQGMGDGLSPHFGYPYGFDGSYFPVSDWIQLLTAQGIGAVTGTVYLGLNVSYALSFAAAAVLAWLASRLAGVPRVLAIVIGVAFTVLPTHWFRIEHITLATIYSLPAALSIALIILRGRLDATPEGRSREFRLWLGGACALALMIAFSGLYYAFYGTFLILLAVLFRVSRADSWKRWLWNLIPLAVLGVFTLLALIPGIRTRLTSEGSVGYERPIYDAVLYSGQMIDAILPTRVSMLPGLGDLAQPLDAINEWANDANTFGVRWIADQGTTLTLLAAIAILLWIAFWGGVGKVAHDGSLSTTGQQFVAQARSTLVFLITAAVLTAASYVPFGFGTYFSTAITLNFRGWDRLIVLFQLLLLVALGLIAALALERVPEARRRLVLIVAVIVAGASMLLDTVLPARTFFDGQLLKGQEQVHAASLVIQDMAAVPQDCAILQLPYRQFPEAAPVARLGVYEPLWFGLVDRTRAWSYGGVYGSKQDQWLQRVSADPVASLGELKAQGFCAILVDSRGYDQAGLDAVTGELARGLGEPIVAQGVEPVLIYRIP